MDRYTLHYINHHDNKNWMDDWHPTKESVGFKTFNEANSYLSIMSEEDNAYIVDNVTNKVIKKDHDKRTSI